MGVMPWLWSVPMNWRMTPRPPVEVTLPSCG